MKASFENETVLNAHRSHS